MEFIRWRDVSPQLLLRAFNCPKDSHIRLVLANLRPLTLTVRTAPSNILDSSEFFFKLEEEPEYGVSIRQLTPGRSAAEHVDRHTAGFAYLKDGELIIYALDSASAYNLIGRLQVARERQEESTGLVHKYLGMPSLQR